LEVHGQHDGRGLLDPITHITLLDLFGGHKSELQAVTLAYQARRDTQKHLKTLKDRQCKAGDDQDFSNMRSMSLID